MNLVLTKETLAAVADSLRPLAIGVYGEYGDTANDDRVKRWRAEYDSMSLADAREVRACLGEIAEYAEYAACLARELWNQT